MDFKALNQFLLAWRNSNEIGLPGSVCNELALALEVYLKEVK